MSDRLTQLASHLNYPRGLLAGQVAIITGAGQGIGAECARLFANEGAKVVVSDIDGVKAEEVAKRIREGGGEALAVQGDLLKDEAIGELVEKAVGWGGKVNVLVNNAGFTWDGVIHKVCLSLIFVSVVVVVVVVVFWREGEGAVVLGGGVGGRC